MGPTAIPCGVCSAPLPAIVGEGMQTVRCAVCGRPYLLELFPAFWRGLAREEQARPLDAPDEAACFYHPSSQAAVVCEGCGRFLCSLCHVPFEGRSLCPSCIQAGFRKRGFPSLDSRRFLYDDLVLALALLPLLAWPITLVTAPAAIVLAIRYWRTPSSLVRRPHVRYLAAIALSAIQIAAWLVFLGVVLIRYIG